MRSSEMWIQVHNRDGNDYLLEKYEVYPGVRYGVLHLPLIREYRLHLPLSRRLFAVPLASSAHTSTDDWRPHSCRVHLHSFVLVPLSTEEASCKCSIDPVCLRHFFLALSNHALTNANSSRSNPHLIIHLCPDIRLTNVTSFTIAVIEKACETACEADELHHATQVPLLDHPPSVDGDENDRDCYTQDFAHLPWHCRPSIEWVLNLFLIMALIFGSIVAKPDFVVNTPIAFNDGSDDLCRTAEVSKRTPIFLPLATLLGGIILSAPTFIIFSLGPLCGEVIIIILAVSHPYTINVNWILLSLILEGITGSIILVMAIVNTYATDCVPAHRRIMAFGNLHRCTSSRKGTREGSISQDGPSRKSFMDAETPPIKSARATQILYPTPLPAGGLPACDSACHHLPFAPVIFNAVFAATMGRFTQTVFVCLAITFGAAFVISWFLKPNVYYDVEKAVSSMLELTTDVASTE
ncbi:hypothetical protein CC78DRAFT_620863 [Lojkania enalia]|uniref:Uncharacterized protein n=1 Tax=Lojkania enalia TaxID=147567 RepID=A0A9P4K531_9PLEO|nr:hypothetical protein CC78DRAFT_620863 [Didymosphaeria enalia]